MEFLIIAGVIFFLLWFVLFKTTTILFDWFFGIKKSSISSAKDEIIGQKYNIEINIEISNSSKSTSKDGK